MLGQITALGLMHGQTKVHGTMLGTMVHGLTKTPGMNMDHGTIMDHGINNGLITDHSDMLTATHTLLKLRMKLQV